MIQLLRPGQNPSEVPSDIISQYQITEIKKTARMVSYQSQKNYEAQALLETYDKNLQNNPENLKVVVWKPPESEQVLSQSAVLSFVERDRQKLPYSFVQFADQAAAAVIEEITDGFVNKKQAEMYLEDKRVKPKLTEQEYVDSLSLLKKRTAEYKEYKNSHLKRMKKIETAMSEEIVKQQKILDSVANKKVIQKALDKKMEQKKRQLKEISKKNIQNLTQFVASVAKTFDIRDTVIVVVQPLLHQQSIVIKKVNKGRGFDLAFLQEMFGDQHKLFFPMGVNTFVYQIEQIKSDAIKLRTENTYYTKTQQQLLKQYPFYNEDSPMFLCQIDTSVLLNQFHQNTETPYYFQVADFWMQFFTFLPDFFTRNEELLTQVQTQTISPRIQNWTEKTLDNQVKGLDYAFNLVTKASPFYPYFHRCKLNMWLLVFIQRQPYGKANQFYHTVRRVPYSNFQMDEFKYLFYNLKAIEIGERFAFLELQSSYYKSDFFDFYSYLNIYGSVDLYQNNQKFKLFDTLTVFFFPSYSLSFVKSLERFKTDKLSEFYFNLNQIDNVKTLLAEQITRLLKNFKLFCYYAVERFNFNLFFESKMVVSFFVLLNTLTHLKYEFQYIIDEIKKLVVKSYGYFVFPPFDAGDTGLKPGQQDTQVFLNQINKTDFTHKVKYLVKYLENQNSFLSKSSEISQIYIKSEYEVVYLTTDKRLNLIKKHESMIQSLKKLRERDKLDQKFFQMATLKYSRIKFTRFNKHQQKYNLRLKLLFRVYFIYASFIQYMDQDFIQYLSDLDKPDLDQQVVLETFDLYSLVRRYQFLLMSLSIKTMKDLVLVERQQRKEIDLPDSGKMNEYISIDQIILDIRTILQDEMIELNVYGDCFKLGTYSAYQANFFSAQEQTTQLENQERLLELIPEMISNYCGLDEVDNF